MHLYQEAESISKCEIAIFGYDSPRQMISSTGNQLCESKKSFGQEYML